MALLHSPRIVTDGLVFYYDMNNTKKSWKGKPTTNMLSNPDWSAGTDNNFTNWTRNNIYSINAIKTVYQDRPCIKLTRIANATGYDGIRGVVTGMQPGTTYTETIRYAVPYTMTQGIRFYLPEYTGGTVTSWNHYVTPQSRTTGWQEFKYTFTTSASATSWGNYYIDWNATASTQPETIYIESIQLEQSSFATSFVNGTRSNAQSLIDVIGKNTITANSLTYNSDGTFSFNGSSNYMTFPENSALNTQTPTVEVWVKTNATTQNGFWFEKGQVNTQYALFQEGANITWRHTTNVSSLTAPAASYINTSQYAQVVGTYTAGARRIYVNGVQVASDALNYTLPTNANGSSIGVYGGFNGSRGYYYNGNIASVKVYNRALSAAEVNQNFNAQRSIYGI